MRKWFNSVIDWFFDSVVDKTSSDHVELKSQVLFGPPITLIK